MQKAIFLDRDGTINMEKHYLHAKEEFEFLPGVTEGLKILQSAGFLLIIITNQSGIGRGYYTEQDFHVLNDWMLGILKQQGIYISGVYYCPHLPNAKITRYRVACSCRKPALGLYERAIREFEIDLERSYAIGDKIRDCAICGRTNCKGYLIGKNEKAEVINAVMNGAYTNVRYAKNLYESAEHIVRQLERRTIK